MQSVAEYAHFYSYGINKCKFLVELIGRRILNLEDNCRTTQLKLRPGYSCILPCQHFNDINCATGNPHSFYKWLKYHFQTNYYVNCPKYMKRHNAMFVSAVYKEVIAFHLPEVYIAI